MHAYSRRLLFSTGPTLLVQSSHFDEVGPLQLCPHQGHVQAAVHTGLVHLCPGRPEGVGQLVGAVREEAVDEPLVALAQLINDGVLEWAGQGMGVLSLASSIYHHDTPYTNRGTYMCRCMKQHGCVERGGAGGISYQ